jgi:hypothetical protein
MERAIPILPAEDFRTGTYDPQIPNNAPAAATKNGSRATGGHCLIL